jgi:hypothetical protein
MIRTEKPSRPENANKRGLSFSVWFYQALLISYPARFRRKFGPEMAQVFRTACQDADQAGFAAILSLWKRVLPDLLVTVVDEWRMEMKTKNLLPLAGGMALLVPAILFLILVFLGYALDISRVRQPFDLFYGAPQFTGWSRVADIFVLGGPVAAVLLNIVPFFRALKIHPEGKGTASISLSSVRWASIAILAVGLVLMAVFAAYFFTENWQCIIGAKASC